MSRLPIPGQDDGTWGAILNDFLGVEHNPNGTLKKSAEIARKYEKPGGGIPKTDLEQSLITKLDGIADGATANAPDTQLRDRSTHTGYQAAATIADGSVSDTAFWRIAGLTDDAQAQINNVADLAASAQATADTAVTTVAITTQATTIATAYQTAIDTAGSSISPRSLKIITEALDTSGVLYSPLWTKIKELWIPAGEDLAAARVKLKKGGSLDSLTNFNFVAADYSERTAIWPGATNSNKKLVSDIHLASVGITATTASMGVYSLSDSWTNGTVLMGSTNNTWFGGYLSAGGVGAFLSGVQPGAAAVQGRRLVIVNSLGGTLSQYRQNAVITSATAGTTVPLGFQLWSYNTGFYSNARIGGYYIASGLTAEEIKTISVFFDMVNEGLGRAINQPAALFFGDSFTQGSGAVPGTNKYSTVVAARLSLTEINAGINGTVLQNTAPVLANNGRDRYVVAVLAKFPEKIFLMYGVNDIRYNDAAWTSAAFENDLNEIVAGLLDAGIRPHQITIGSPGYFDPVLGAGGSAPWNGVTAQRQSDHRDAARNVANLYGCVFRDVYQMTLDYVSNGLIYSDNLHPSNAGHEFIARVLLGEPVSRQGKATLVSGSVTIAATWFDYQSSIIEVGRYSSSGTVGASYSVTYTGTSGGGTSFTITSINGAGATQTADSSILWWRVVKP